MMRASVRWLAACWVFSAAAFAQSDLHYQTDFPPEEFRARWERIFDRIGDRAFAVVQGFPKVNGFIFPRQTNELYYLCGVETPQSYLVLDGKTRRAILFLHPRDQRLEQSEGRVLSAADGDLAKKLTGASEVLSTKTLTVEWLGHLGRETGPVIYTPFAPAEGYAQSRGELVAANESIASDYWDGRVSREAHFIGPLRTRLPRVEVRDLTPIVDELRLVKSPCEVTLVRRASQIAGLALVEAMRSTRPGLFEYHLDTAARYVFLVNGARLDAYRSITAAGTPNIWNMQYYRNDGSLKDGDLVLMDYAPDYHYYVSDVARMWPVNGKFNPMQQELLGFVLEYRNAILKRICPGVTADQVVEEEVLKPGHVFSVDPQLRVPEENLYIRYEDMVAIMDKGVENFTDFLASDLDDIERMVRGDGIVQKSPPAAK